MVRDILKKAQAGEVSATISVINLGEIYYIIARKQGQGMARTILEDVSSLPIDVADATFDRVIAAAQIKANYSLSYADAFVAATAMEFSATILTGDPEFKALESQTPILWL